MAFLDGLPPERLCQPMVDYFKQKGGELRWVYWQLPCIQVQASQFWGTVTSDGVLLCAAVHGQKI